MVVSSKVGSSGCASVSVSGEVTVDGLVDVMGTVVVGEVVAWRSNLALWRLAGRDDGAA